MAHLRAPWIIQIRFSGFTRIRLHSSTFEATPLKPLNFMPKKTFIFHGVSESSLKMEVSYTQFSSVSAQPQFRTMMSLKLNSPAANGFQILQPLTKSNMCILSIRSYGTHSIARPKIICNMSIAAGKSDEPLKFNLEKVIDRARKLWDSSPAPIKSFPWNRAANNFVQLTLDIVLTVTKYLYVPVLIVTSISELSYCAHERKLYITLLPFLVGVGVAGILKSAVAKSSPSLKNAEVPWHLIAIGLIFTLLKLPGPYYPYWGRIFIPHFANGALFRTLWFAFLWYRRPRKSLEKTLNSVVLDPEQKVL